MLLLLACGGDPVPVAPTPTPAQTLDEVRQGLGTAHRAWSAGTYDVAREGVLQTYQGPFARREPALRAQDPRATLELEVAFAVLAQHLGRKGNPVDIAGEVRALNTRVEAAVSTLPQPEGTPPQPEAPPERSSTTTIPVSPPTNP